MNRNYTESERLTPIAQQWTPGGSQTGSKAPGRAGPLGSYPAFLKSGYGCYSRDVDNNDYLDFIAGLAAVALGHAHPVVVDAVQRAVIYGSLLSLPHPLENEAAEQLCSITGWAESVRWVKTGSEATEAAVRIARCATGRSLVLTVESGYHGWHSWFQAVKPDHPGVPWAFEEVISGLPYGDVTQFDAALGSRQYACVILEPAPVTGGGDTEFLRWLVERAHACGTLVIFDEMVWGFRFGPAGFGVANGITPDLACYGKALGNGVPVAAVVGKRDLMQHATLVSGTYGGDLLGLSAAVAVMATYQQQDVCAWLWSLGTHFKVEFNALSARIATTVGTLGAECSGYPVHPVIRFSLPDENLAMSVFCQELADHGVLWHPAGGNIIAAMTNSILDEYLANAFEPALRVVAECVEAGTLAERLRGQRYQAAFARAAVTR